MKKPDARRKALVALEQIRRQGIFLDEAISLVSEGLNAADKALCNKIVRGTVQNTFFLDYYLSLYLSRSINRIEPTVLDILRISAYQLLFLDRIPPSAVVNEAVSICKKQRRHAASLVNAVLRKLSDAKDKLPPISADTKSEFLSVKYSHPLWLCEYFIKICGYDFTEKFLLANNTEPGITLQTNTLKCSVDSLLYDLTSKGYDVKKAGTDSSLIIDKMPNINSVQEYCDGMFYVQDDAAFLSVAQAAPKEKMKILDLCAAPGGKSFAAAILSGNNSEVLSCDVSEKRLSLVAEGATRLGLSCIKTKLEDARVINKNYINAFDLVIADVPCSGLGVIRKKPEIRYKSRESIAELPALQLEILNNASSYVAPGGTLLYSTCTLIKEENNDVVNKFLSSNNNFNVLETRSFWPHIDNTDGFYICIMKKSI